MWTDLEAYDGYGAWFDIGLYGYLIGTYDNPFKGRFLFTSDGAWSDGDGENTVGGGFACDNIKLFDFYNSTVYFYDDAESGGLCVAGHPGASGDWWHLKYDDCSSYSRLTTAGGAVTTPTRASSRGFSRTGSTPRGSTSATGMTACCGPWFTSRSRPLTTTTSRAGSRTTA